MAILFINFSSSLGNMERGKLVQRPFRIHDNRQRQLKFTSTCKNKKLNDERMKVCIPQVFLIELLLLHFEGSPKLEFLLLLSDTCNSNHNS
ncbi:hypothetical protein Patl1_33854 [Pistacia atlantica]|uniref:Uncharacterized protein n=1 Tax=Pistacia atlantica TaxID=434234 RepID=A0ACC0ZR23_9ROSI|nr:hypothetical protein Patl1_33854 [Pistacia atlantica]